MTCSGCLKLVLSLNYQAQAEHPLPCAVVVRAASQREKQNHPSSLLGSTSSSQKSESLEKKTCKITPSKGPFAGIKHPLLFRKVLASTLPFPLQLESTDVETGIDVSLKGNSLEQWEKHHGTEFRVI